eukprot:Gb_07177 [translate_table: standard]
MALENLMSRGSDDTCYEKQHENGRLGCVPENFLAYLFVGGTRRQIKFSFGDDNKADRMDRDDCACVAASMTCTLDFSIRTPDLLWYRMGFTEMKDPGFKLFGKTIPMKHDGGEQEKGFSALKSEQESDESMVDVEIQARFFDKGIGKENGPEYEEEGRPDGSPEELGSFTSTNNCKEEECKDSKQEPEKEMPTTAVENDLKKEKNEEGDTETNDKMPKKPDKLLPCPRCDSLDTKFCYYNNYNVNQPRHFCKNCQRYWTAGGTMRNVPVGAGRRKNKHSASHYRHMMMSDGLTTARADAPDAAHHQVIPSTLSSAARALKASRIQLLPLDIESIGGTLLNFGPDTPLCESMATALNLADHAMVTRNAFKNKDDEKGSMSCGENRDDISCGSSITASPSAEKEEAPRNLQSIPQMDQGGLTGWPNGVVPQQPFYGGVPWSYGWNVGWGSHAAPAGVCANGMTYGAENGNSNNGPPGAGAPGMWATAGIPWPFVPGSYWGPHTSWAGGPWNMPWAVPASPATGGLSSSPSSSNSGGSGSPTLGKHSRDIPHSEGKTDGCLWVPKTLRIDDPGEAARSSVWTTLGAGNKPESITTGGIFKAFQPKTEDKEPTKASAQRLLANPAAFSRSVAFQESA